MSRALDKLIDACRRWWILLEINTLDSGNLLAKSRPVFELSRRGYLAGTVGQGIVLYFADLARANPDRPWISVADFGVLPDGSDSRPGVQKAAARLPRAGGATLHFPPGVYTFSEGLTPAIDISNIENFFLDAVGCTFLFNNSSIPIALTKCANARLSGFTIDWQRPPFTQAEVVAIDPMSADVRTDPGFPVDGSESFNALGTYDRAIGQMAVGGIDAYHVVDRAELVGDQLLRLTFNRRLPLRRGDTVVLRHNVPGYAHAIILRECDGVRIDFVNVYASCSMALVGDRCRDVKIQRFEVKRKPGSSRLLSTNADAVHMANCSGVVGINDCLLAGMGDDCINVHAQFLKLARLSDSRTAIVENKAETPFGNDDLPRAGDRFILSRANSLEPLGEAVVVGAEAGAREAVHFATDLPRDFRPGDLLCDATNIAALTVSRCRFPGNRARGVLGHSDVVIENCQFSHQSESAVLLTPDEFWMECGSAARVKINNNEFNDVLRLRRPKEGAITIDAVINANNQVLRSAAHVNRDIVIEGNTIADAAGSAIAANAVDGLTIENNRIERCTGLALAMGAVWRVTVRGNRCTPAAQVSIQAEYRDEVNLANNSGLLP